MSMEEKIEKQRDVRILESRRRRILLPLLLLAAFGLRAATLWLPHVENDEVIYTEFAKRVWEEPLRYNLKGSPLLNVLPPKTYGRPLFHHPPLFVYSLALVGGTAGWRWLALLPALAGVGTVIWVYGIARMEFGKGEALWACAIAAFCPVGWFGSTKIWIDPYLTFYLAGAFFFEKRAASSGRVGFSFLAGLFLGLGLLCKLSGSLMVPCLLFLTLSSGRGRWRRLLAWGLTASFLFLPWMALFFSTYGTFFPSWIRFGKDALVAFPFVADGYAQPPAYWIGFVISVVPVYLFSVPGTLLSRREKRGAGEMAWAFCFFAGFTLFGLLGGGYFTRYVVPAFPPLAVLSAVAVSRGGRTVRLLATALLLYGLFNGLFNIVLHWSPDLYPFTSYLLPVR